MITRLGGVHHRAGSRHDADMVNTTTVAKEDQITSLVLPIGYMLALMVLVLRRGGAGNLLVGSVVDGVLRQARAIKTSFRLARP